MSDLAIKTETKNEVITEQQLKDYAKTFLATQNLSDNEISQFIGIAKAFQLNPFKREIYCIAYGSGQYRTLQIVTGYEVYLKRAERLDLLNGYETSFSGSISRSTISIERNKKGGEGTYNKSVEVCRGDLSCTITIYRKDREKPFKKTIYFEEFTQDNEIWNSKPRFMLEKVALSIGFRQCFPDEMGGMPYTNEEIKDEQKDVTPEKQPDVKNNKQQSNKQQQPKPKVQDAEIIIEDTVETRKKLFSDFTEMIDKIGMNLDAKDGSTAHKICIAYNENDPILTAQYLFQTIEFISNKYNVVNN
ncbi:MAG: phage recombination protein Bet [Spirochaetes bacterium GWF1_31_7]|nr:MAG: phage recombination protein Bet [Spirochaetes bacterium GWE1_32_154]OHD50734.1 MAG: phage recombination protein Bet [Spirochaetes bacterium GWF1_31_7]OHD81472.1 MAG: phage recombination protein Bet [Spirochaetes bacterium RIFOXYB1_FULL_32_8]HBD95071.1 phage recombination protein Bet [Spirochaetia bacterium]HBI38043.1 phage recombination protein Bet [Spirochaetia bacterium]